MFLARIDFCDNAFIKYLFFFFQALQDNDDERKKKKENRWGFHELLFESFY